jgi:hypothetical protein
MMKAVLNQAYGNNKVRDCIMIEGSEDALNDAVLEFYVTRGTMPDVIVVPLPLVMKGETAGVYFVDRYKDIPVAVCRMDVFAVIVTDTQAFCDLKQKEKELEAENEH